MSMSDQFRLWANGCAHVFWDKRNGRESLADALRQSEAGGSDGGPAFDWDICLNVGDYSAEFGLPTDEEGAEIVRQFSVLERHQREDIYSICGNHDRDGLDGPEGHWFRKWIDPFGENTEISGVDRTRYLYPINGTWERYWFEVGNILFLMMSDVNEKSQALGRGPLGGNPGGAVTRDTYDWWAEIVEKNRDDRIIITAHHYVLKDTTVASGEWGGMSKDENGNWRTEYHGYHAEGTPNGASYLYWVGGRRDSQLFESYLEANPGAVDLWLGGHTHTNPDDTHGGKSHIETNLGGTHFINVAALTRHFMKHAKPHSRLLTFSPDSDEVIVQCYMHTNEYRPQGWYHAKERLLKLSRPFSWDA